MSIYRYFDHNGLLSLQTLTLKVTPPNEFDDPFEFSPVVHTQDLLRAAERRIDGILQDPTFFNNNRAAFPGIASFQQLQTLAADPHRKTRLIADMAQATPGLNADFQKHVQDILSRTLGVICFTTDPKNLLMWALYADKHKKVQG